MHDSAEELVRDRRLRFRGKWSRQIRSHQSIPAPAAGHRTKVDGMDSFEVGTFWCRWMWMTAPMLVICGWLTFSQPVAVQARDAIPKIAPSAVLRPSSAATDAVPQVVAPVPPSLSGEFIPAPTAGLPDPMCTSPSDQRQCVVSSLASNAQGDVFAAFGSGVSPGDLGLYRLTAGADRWERLAVADPTLPAEGAALLVPAVAVSEDGSLFALAFWPGRAVDGAMLRSLDNGETWLRYARAAAGTSQIAIDRTDTLWVGAAAGLLRSRDPASVHEPPGDRESMLALVRTECFMAGMRAGHLVEFADGSFQCRFPDGSLILCPPDLKCTVSGPSGVTGPYPPPGRQE